MLTSSADLNPKVGAPITKEDLENQLKAFAKGELHNQIKQLHNQIKKDVHTEMLSAIGKEGALTKVTDYH